MERSVPNPDVPADTNESATNRHRPNSFVIFRIGNDENYVYDLPPLLMTSTGNTSLSSLMRPWTTTTNSIPSSSVTVPSSEAHSSSTPMAPSPLSNLTSAAPHLPQPGDASRVFPDPVTEIVEQRNMSISVTYAYSQISREESRNPQRSGTIMLNVPNVPLDRSERQMTAMIELAASIALGAVAVYSQRRQPRIDKDAFAKFPLRDPAFLDEAACPICYDDYLKIESGKRSRDDDEGDEKLGEYGHCSKKIRRLRRGVQSESLSVPPTTSQPLIEASIVTPTREQRDQDPQHTHESTEEEEYAHVPIELPCGHVFGRNCAYTWLMAKNTCPLCRALVHSDFLSQDPPETINLPNIASLMNSSDGDRQMVVVLDSNANTLFTSQANLPSSSSTSTATEEEENDEEEASMRNLRPLTGFDDRTSPLQPLGISRDPLSQAVWRELETPMTDGLFTTGVASRRTRNGVETYNLDNDSRTMRFRDEARRLLLRRSTANSRTLLGFDDNGQFIRLERPSPQGEADPDISTDGGNNNNVNLNEDTTTHHAEENGDL